MTTRPIQTTGELRNGADGWVIKLAEANPTFEEGMPVKAVIWDNRNESSKSEVERIATTQQLDPSIVALALSSEGALNR